MWKSAYVGVYQLLNWKMHSETLKLAKRYDSTFLRSMPCSSQPTGWRKAAFPLIPKFIQLYKKRMANRLISHTSTLDGIRRSMRCRQDTNASSRMSDLSCLNAFSNTHSSLLMRWLLPLLMTSSPKISNTKCNIGRQSGITPTNLTILSA